MPSSDFVWGSMHWCILRVYSRKSAVALVWLFRAVCRFLVLPCPALRFLRSSSCTAWVYVAVGDVSVCAGGQCISSSGRVSVSHVRVVEILAILECYCLVYLR